MTDNIISIPPSEARRTSDALADVICWLGGFRSAGGDTAPIDYSTLDALGDLNMKIKDLKW